MLGLDDFETGRLIFLLLLLVTIVGSVLIGGLQKINQQLQNLAIWLLIFIALTVSYSMRDDLSAVMRGISNTGTQQSAEGSVVLNRAMDGHYYAEMLVNGVPVRFTVDTGATNLVLSSQDAERIGFNADQLRFTGRAHTANGMVRTAPVRLETIEFGPFFDRNQRAQVNGGELESSLLGMSYLSLFNRIEITGRQMRLFRD